MSDPIEQEQEQPKVASMEAAEKKAIGLITAKATSYGKVRSVIAYSNTIQESKQFDSLYVVEGHVEVETQPEMIVSPAQRNIWGKETRPAQVRPALFRTAIWVVQLSVTDLATRGTSIKF